MELDLGVVGEVGLQVVVAATVEDDGINVVSGQVADEVEEKRLHVVVARIEEPCGVVIARIGR